MEIVAESLQLPGNDLMKRRASLIASAFCLFVSLNIVVGFPRFAASDENEIPIERLKYNHPGLVVDLGVGLWAWPIPIDFDKDGYFYYQAPPSKGEKP